jgi:hypothetical protein
VTYDEDTKMYFVYLLFDKKGFKTPRVASKEFVEGLLSPEEFEKIKNGVISKIKRKVRKNKAPYKIGMTHNIKRRFEAYEAMDCYETSKDFANHVLFRECDISKMNTADLKRLESEVLFELSQDPECHRTQINQCGGG